MRQYEEAQWYVIGAMVNLQVRDMVLSCVQVEWFEMGQFREMAQFMMGDYRGWMKRWSPIDVEGGQIQHYSNVVSNIDFWLEELARQYKSAQQKILFEVGYKACEGVDPDSKEYDQIVEQLNTLEDVGTMLEERPDYHQEFIDANDESIPKLKMPFPKMDENSPVQVGEYVLVCGRPGTGKTSFASQWMLKAAANGARVLYFCLDDPRRLGLAKFASQSIRGLNGAVVTAQQLNKDPNGEDACNGFNYFKQLNIDFAPATIQSIEDIVAYTAKYKAKYPDLLMVVVDHMTKIIAPGRTGHEMVSCASRELFSLSKRFNLTVVALSQLNRSVETENRPVRLSDLRESGSLEEDATMVISFHLEGGTRAECAVHVDDKGLVDIWRVRMSMLKNKAGYLYGMDLQFNGPCFSFME